ncbi:uncharacterized protein METZ01_LOCUS421616, partial [marine metagenome]
MIRSFNDQPIETLIEQNLLQEGTVLDLRLKYIGDEGMGYLAQCTELINLSELKLERNDITDKGIDALARSTIVTGLKSLSLERNA